MNKTNRIRTFFILGAGVLIGSYSLWNYSVQMREEMDAKEKQQTEQAKEEATRETGASKSAYEYVIVNENGYLTVYKKDLKTVYFNTDISYRELSTELQEKIDNGYPIQDTQELYDFLENYSS